MKVLVACEFSGVVREAFRSRGHNAWSCDFLPAEDGSKYHYTEDVSGQLVTGKWDLMIAHPPCTHLAVSGARWFKDKQAEQAQALNFVRYLLEAPIPKIALENPVSVISTKIRKPDQIIHPWMFGHPERKTTCLWLKGLPKLQETQNVKNEMEKLPKRLQERLHYLSPSENRWKLRSTTFTGIAEAMADQWGEL